MRKPRGAIGSLPGDGLLKLMPGAVFAWHSDTPISPSIADLRKWMNDIRGSVLSSSFGIENELVMLALADEFGSNNHGWVGSGYFAREQEWRADHGLKRKIDRVKPIIRRRRDTATADSMMQKLAGYRELRNLLAHHPCWLEPVNLEGVTEPEQQRTIALRLFIADENYVWEIDAAQAADWSALILSVRVSVENVRREIVGAPLLNDDGSLPVPGTAPGESADGMHAIQHGGVSQIVIPRSRDS